MSVNFKPQLLLPLLLQIIATIILANYQQVFVIECLVSSATNNKFYARPGILAGEIMRERGYSTRDFEIRSRDGYTLRVTRGRNPLIKGGSAPGRKPILFVHGSLESFNVWVMNSFEAEPSDLSSVNLAELTLEAINMTQLAELPSAKSLPLLAMDFGHEVWLMSRRGFPGSQKKVGNLFQGFSDRNGNTNEEGPLGSLLPGLLNFGHLAHQIPFTLDADFWQFSLDEQAEYDLPAVVELVRRETGQRQVSLVAHSSGGALALMALSLKPDLNDKLASVTLWADTFSVGNSLDLFSVLAPAFRRPLQAYVGPLPPAFMTSQLQAMLGVLCATEAAQRTLCEGLFDLVFGFSGGQAPMRPEFVNTLLYGSASHELAQTMQTVALGGHTHNYTSAGHSLAHAEPYDLSRITNTRLAFYVGISDFVASPADVRATRKLLRVPHHFHLIDTAFNHNGFFYHENAARLAVIPSLREIQLLSSS